MRLISKGTKNLRKTRWERVLLNPKISILLMYGPTDPG